MERDPLEGEPRTPGDAGGEPDDREERPEPGGEEEAGADEIVEGEEEELTPAEATQLREENRRLKLTNDSLTRMKGKYERLQEDHEEALEELGRRDGRAEDEMPRLSRADLEAIQQSPVLARALNAIARSHQIEVGKLRHELSDVRDRVEARGIPLEDDPAVDRLMKSGHFTTRRGAHLALLGLRARKASQQRRAEGADRTGERTQPATRREVPVATTRRGLTPRQREQAGVTTMAEHRRRMDRDGEGYDPEYVKRYREGKVNVVRRR